MESIIVDYFQKLFDSTGVADASTILNAVARKVTAQISQSLLLPFSDEEIKSALFQMHPTKAPKPDGMTHGFYQKHWTIVGHDICYGVHYLLSSGSMLRKVNFTHVTLIPK